MKKEFSFYEFVGILIPGTMTLYGLNYIFFNDPDEQIFNIEKVGETIVFLVVSYAAGHFIQAVGNLFEMLIWKIYGGTPSVWLIKPNRFGKSLFSSTLNQTIREKVVQKYGSDENECIRLVYNSIYLAGKSARIDIFNGNYSMFRGLAIAFLILGVTCAWEYDLNWWQCILSLVPFLLMTRRMMRFAKYYAKETYRTFYNL